MVAHASSCCNDVAAVTSTSIAGRRPAPPSAVAPRRPLSTSRNKSGRNGKKARTAGRRCEEVIRRKMEALKRLIPSDGGDGDHDGDETDGGSRVDELLFRAADYIVRLQVQVKAMQLMVDVLEHTK